MVEIDEFLHFFLTKIERFVNVEKWWADLQYGSPQIKLRDVLFKNIRQFLLKVDIFFNKKKTRNSIF